MTAIEIGTDLPKDKVSDIINSSELCSQVDCISFKNRDVYSFKIESKNYDEVFVFSNMADLVQNIINKIYMKKIISKRTAYLLRGFMEDEFTEIEDSVYEIRQPS